jgi:hypothetical protein
MRITHLGTETDLLGAGQQSRNRRSRLARRCASIAVASMALLCWIAPAAQALPENFFGISSDAGAFWKSDADWNVIGHSGAQTFHMQLNWGEVAGEGHNWETAAAWEATYDKYITSAIRNGLTVVPYLYGRKDNSPQYYLESEPANWNAWLEFVRTAVQRYGYNGSFWSANPGLPYTPIHIWEVWNEPNLAENNPDKIVTPKAYAKFLMATTTRIRSAQSAIGGPGATVLHGGLFQGYPAMSAPEFISTANGITGYQAAFDGLSLHPYSFVGNEAAKFNTFVQNVGEARSAVNKNGGGGTKPIYITELGWPRAGNFNKGEPVSIGEAEQTSLLNKTFSWAKENYGTYNIALVAWYFYRDAGGGTQWAHYCGLRNSAGEYRTSWWAYQEVAGASRWPLAVHSDTLGGTVTSSPDISSWNPGRLDVFVRGAGESLAHTLFEGGTGWGSWENWGSALASESGPGAVSWAPSRIDVVGRAPAGNVTHWYWDGTSMHNGDNLGGSITADPDISSWGPGRLDVFGRGKSGELTHRYHETNTGGWGPSWENWGGSLATGAGPGAVSWGPGRIDIVGRAPDGSVTHWYWDGTTLHTGDNLGGKIKGDPDISSWGPGRLDVFARGEDDALWQKTFANGRWYEWERLGGTLASGPGAVSWSENRIDVVAKSPSNEVTHWWLSP